MGLRFFADHCIPNSVIKGLLDGGHEVLRLRNGFEGQVLQYHISKK
jgi:hypothetical protein